MAVVNGTAANNTFSPGQSNILMSYNGLGGIDTLFVDSNTSKSQYRITQHGMDIWVDSISAASGVHWVLNSVEKINFQSGGIVDLTVLFPTAFAVDTTVPTVTTFSPADGSIGAAINANIVVTFSETVVRGAGNIVIRDSGTSAVVATYDAATSTNLTISGSVLTINPTVDLALSTGYTVEFAAGSIKDAAGNSFAGTTAYNFTTAATSVINGTAINDILTGTAGADVINGLAGNDTLNGNNGNDTLDGGAGNDSLDGGIGADSMVGGLGNDTYVVDNLSDVITELVAQGTDLVKSSVDCTLGDNVEKLTLTGNAIISGTGNALNNIITGNASNNILIGGAGVDTLIGGAGNDTYHVNLKTTGIGAATVASLQDVITEIAGAGNDTVILTSSAVLTKASTITLATTLENLDASGTGSTLLNLTGNASANSLTGNDAANVLNGGLGADTLIGGLGDDKLVGGLGLDNLTGGGGSDIFVFDSALNVSTNLDTVVDFVSGTDHIQLSSTVFSHLKGDIDLTDNFHVAGVGTQDANDFIVYDGATGALYYDADGSGVVLGVQFAEIGTSTHPALLATDMFVV